MITVRANFVPIALLLAWALPSGAQDSDLKMLADSLAAQIKTKGKAPVAITSFVNSDYGSAFSNYVVDRLVVLLSKGNNDFDVVARDRVEETFKEMNLALARNYDSSTFAKVGKQLGAHSLIRGSYTVQSAAALVSIVAQIVDVETGRIIGGEVVETRLTGDLKAMLSSPDVGAPHLSRAVDQTRGAASTSGALPPVAPNAPRFQNDFLIATVDSVGFSRDTSGSYISLSVNFENRSTREELLMCVRRTLMDDQAREWEQSQGSGLAAMRNGYNYAYGPNGVAYSVSDHARFSPRVEQAAIMRFMRNGSPTESAGPSTVSLAMDCYRRRGDIDEPFSIAITRIPIGGGQAR